MEILLKFLSEDEARNLLSWIYKVSNTFEDTYTASANHKRAKVVDLIIKDLLK